MNSEPLPTVFGATGEDAAAAFLEQHGFTVLERNYHTRRGEIDLIAIDGGCLVFVEVKSSKRIPLDRMRERIDSRKQRRLYLAAQEYLLKRQPACDAVRFDALLMRQVRAEEWQVEHLPDAFRLDEMPE